MTGDPTPAPGPNAKRQRVLNASQVDLRINRTTKLLPTTSARLDLQKTLARKRKEMIIKPLTIQERQAQRFKDTLIGQKIVESHLRQVASKAKRTRKNPTLQEVLMHNTATGAAAGKSSASLMKPSPLLVLAHPFGPTLEKWSNDGVPVDCGEDWTLEAIMMALERGPHPSAATPESIMLFSENIQYQVQAGFSQVVLASDLLKNPPKQLKISPVAVVPQPNRRGRIILDLSFPVKRQTRRALSQDLRRLSKKQRRRVNNLAPAVNNATNTTAPLAPVKLIGKALNELFEFIAVQQPGDDVLLSKIDLSDGFWRMIVTEDARYNFCYVLPQPAGEPIRIVVPSAFQMGWKDSPPYFCTATETRRDFIDWLIATKIELPPHPFEKFVMPKNCLTRKRPQNVKAMEAENSNNMQHKMAQIAEEINKMQHAKPKIAANTHATNINNMNAKNINIKNINANDIIKMQHAKPDITQKQPCQIINTDNINKMQNAIPKITPIQSKGSNPAEKCGLMPQKITRTQPRPEITRKRPRPASSVEKCALTPQKITKIQPRPEISTMPPRTNIPTALAKPWRVAAYVDNYILAIISSQGIRFIRRAARAALYGIHAIFPPPEVTEHQGGKDPISVKKLENGDARLDITKEILGFQANGRNQTWALPTRKMENIYKEGPS